MNRSLQNQTLDSNYYNGRNIHIIPARKEISRFREEAVTKKRVCAYCRVSTEEESQATSYDLQVSYYTDYIKRNSEWKFKGVYADEGISGTSTKNREQFLKMIQDCYDGKIDYIITKSISRFARNTLDCLQYIRRLKNLDNPVGVYFEKENIDTLDGKSELFLTILSSLAQDESRSISENAKWGVQKRFQRGEAHIPTTYFLGYDTDEDGNLVINEEEAKIIRRIYKACLGGKGTNVIARELMEDGILTARGNAKWTSNAVYKILKNEKYCGDVLMQKTVTLDFLSHKRVINREHQPQYFVQDHHPAIINKEDWYAVQDELKRRHLMFHDPENKYRQNYSGKCVFSNRFFCAECGRPVVRRRLTSSKNKKKYCFSAWQCRVSAGNDKEFKGCHARYLWESSIEEAFMKLLYKMKVEKERIIEEVKASIVVNGLSEAEENRIEEIERQYRAITSRANEMSRNSSRTNGDIYEATLKQLTYEQGILQTEWDKFMDKKQIGLNLENQLKALIDILEQLDNIEEGQKIDFRDDYFLQTVEKGIMHGEGMIDFEFKCGITKSIQAFMRRSPKKKEEQQVK